MSDDLLESLGRAGRDEREKADELTSEAPALSELARERLATAALGELMTGESKAAPSAKQRRRGLPAAVMSGLALAAAIALWMGTRRESLPDYQLSVQGSTAEWRSSDHAASVDRVDVRADGTLELLLRPATPVTRALEARAFAVRGQTTRELPVRVSAQGVVRVSGSVDELFGANPAPGEWTVTLVVGPTGQIPPNIDDATPRAGVRVVRSVVAITSAGK